LKEYKCVEVKHHEYVSKAIEQLQKMDGAYTLSLALNTESVATFITTCYLKKASKISFLFFFIKFEY